MERIYDVDRDTAHFAIFREGAASGSCRNAEARRVDNHEPLSGEDLAYDPRRCCAKADVNDILTDLCMRGELEPGEYTIELWW